MRLKAGVRRAMLLLLLLSAALNGWLLAHPKRQPPPVPSIISAVPETFDIGTIDQGGSARATFQLKAAQPTKITRVDTGCGCTVANLQLPAQLIPGQTTPLELEFRAGGLRGPFERRVRIMTEGLAAPKIVVLKGIVRPLYQAEPEIVNFGDVKIGEKVTRTVRISAVEGKLPTEWVDLSNPLVTAGPIRRISPGEIEFDLTAAPTAVNQSLSTAVLAATGDTRVAHVGVRTVGRAVH